jgi:hypothetical protein
MPNTYSTIATTTFAGSTNSVTFSSIPGSYTDLRLVISYSISGELIQARFNGDTASNYSCTNLYGTGTTAASNRRVNFTEARLGLESANTNSRGVLKVDFMGYSNSTTYKTVLSRCDNAGQETNARVNLWRSTANIGTILISTFNASFNFSAGDTATLYGIAAA